MGLAAGILPEFDHEMANTRKMLERVPADQLDWTPHEKSMNMVGLVTHLANVPSWTALAVNQDSFDMAPPGEEPPRTDPVASVQAALELFDENVAAGRAAIEGASDERLMAPWSLLSGGHEVFSMPRIAVLRSMIMSHMIHHRGQLSVYLRLTGVSLPAVYGPSADET